MFTDDFEVSLFLTNSGTRHTVMTKQKTFRSAPRLLSNSNRLTTSGHDSVQVEIRQEPLDSPGIGLNDIPAAPTAEYKHYAANLLQTWSQEGQFFIHMRQYKFIGN